MRIYALVKFIHEAHINVSVKERERERNDHFIDDEKKINKDFNLEYTFVFGSTIIHICGHGRFSLQFGQSQTCKCKVWTK